MDSFNNRTFSLIENYIYLHHLDEFIILPVYPQQISDTSNLTMSSTSPLMRSAPIQSYSSSGPRTVNFSFRLHREMMYEVNYKRSNVLTPINDDYVDTIINYLQAAAYPKYDSSIKMVDPPMVSVRVGSDIYIRGIVQGSVSTTYNLPIIVDKNGNNKYAVVDISFSVAEVDPVDADMVKQSGSFRGLNTTLERNVWKQSNSLSSSVVTV